MKLSATTVENWTVPTTPTGGYNGHGEDCICVKCISAEWKALEKLNGVEGRYTDAIPETVHAERTRYAEPGQKVGRGYVREMSTRQKKYLRFLLDTKVLIGKGSKLTDMQRSYMGIIKDGSDAIMESLTRVSLVGIKEIISNLVASADKEISARAERMATEKQAEWLGKLSGKDVSEEIEAIRIKGKNATFAEAHKALDVLFKAGSKSVERKATENHPESNTEAFEVVEGMYLYQNEVYKVQRAVHGSGQLYAKRLVKLEESYTKISRNKEILVTHEFVYEGARILRSFTAENKMTKDQAIEYGALYGVCCVCSKTLTDEKSIERGMGKTCASKF